MANIDGKNSWWNSERPIGNTYPDGYEFPAVDVDDQLYRIACHHFPESDRYDQWDKIWVWRDPELVEDPETGEGLKVDTAFYVREMLRHYRAYYQHYKPKSWHWNHYGKNETLYWERNRREHAFGWNANTKYRIGNRIFIAIRETDDTYLFETAKTDSILRDALVLFRLTDDAYLEGGRYYSRYIFGKHQEFDVLAAQSEINAPILMTKGRFDDIKNMAEVYPQWRRIIDNRIIYELFNKNEFQKSQDALDHYLKTYPPLKEGDRGPVMYSAPFELRRHAGDLAYMQGDSIRALELYLEAGGGIRIAVIAEALMSLDELLDFCKKHASQPQKGKYYDSIFDIAWFVQTTTFPREMVIAELRMILARRLMREGRYAEAEVWFGEDAPDDLELSIYGWAGREFAKHRKTAENPALDSETRAIAYLNLAQLSHLHNSKLYSTFLTPNFHIIGMYRPYPSDWQPDIVPDSYHYRMPSFDKYHARHRAIKLYGKAIELSSNDLLKDFAYIGIGRLVKGVDPEAIDPYYKALARRRTVLGKLADEQRWFPWIDDERFERYPLTPKDF